MTTKCSRVVCICTKWCNKVQQGATRCNKVQQGAKSGIQPTVGIEPTTVGFEDQRAILCAMPAKELLDRELEAPPRGMQHATHLTRLITGLMPDIRGIYPNQRVHKARGSSPRHLCVFSSPHSVMCPYTTIENVMSFV